MRNKIKKVNELIREKCSSISTTRINYIEQDHDWIDEGSCLRTKYYYRDCLHLVEFGNKKLINTIIKAIQHSNLTIPMNASKYKATTVLTGEDFPPLSSIPLKRSILNFYPLRLHTKIHGSLKLFVRHKVAAATASSALQSVPVNNYNRLHEIKTKKRKLNSHQDLSNNSAATRYYQEKENSNQEITNFIQYHIQQHLQ